MLSDALPHSRHRGLPTPLISSDTPLPHELLNTGIAQPENFADFVKLVQFFPEHRGRFAVEDRLGT